MGRILVLDDNKGICLLLKELFTMDGHEVKAYSDIDEFNYEVEKFKPDIGLFDVNMGSDMLKVINKLRNLHPHMVSVFMSADEPDGRFREYPFILKPFDITKLKDLVYSNMYNNMKQILAV